jgi:hypothetical protein
MSDDRINIKISPETKTSLDYFRKRVAINDYIAAMLNYFANTGVNPMNNQAGNTKKILDRFEDIIKIIRAIEKNKIDEIVRYTRNQSGEGGQNKSNETVDEVSLSELQEVLAKNENLKQQIQQLEHQLDGEQRKVTQLSAQIANTDSAYSTSLIKEIQEKLQDISIPDKLQDDKYKIDKSEMHFVDGMLQKLLEKNKR